jgi:ribosomal protein L40E
MHLCTSIPLSLIDDAVVTSRRTVSQSSQSGFIVGSGYNAAIIQGNAASTSVMIGDVTFTRSGKNYMTFSQVQDPDGVANVFQSTKSVILSEEEYHEYLNPSVQLEPKIGELVCPKCKGNNSEDALFCNKCGLKISITCANCGVLNSCDSLFCNKCGTKF